MSSLMAVSSASLIIPATLYAAMSGAKQDDKKDNILILSHGTAIILLILYVLYLFFQLKTHADLFDEEEGSNDENGDHKQDEPQTLSPTAAGIALVVITVCVAVCAEYLVDSIDSIVQTLHISKTFIGLILLPIVGNAAEHVTAVVVACKDKMDLAIGVAIGSSMQIALLVTPFLVILGWIIDKPMTLHFEIFETVVLFLSVLITNYLISVGSHSLLYEDKTLIQNRMENRIILKVPCSLGCEYSLCYYDEWSSCTVANCRRYTIIALAFFVYPDNAAGAGVAHSLLSLV